jgi:misacylated tRNA(Ala) deacylase
VSRIVDLDVQADGGTHVASTRQLGGVPVVEVESTARRTGEYGYG